jgi:hypothetical protein
VLTTIEDVDVVVAVDTDTADFFERPAFGQFRPVGIDAVLVVAASDDHRNNPSRGRSGLPSV